MADSTGLVFLRARYMQPGLGMFLSRDPALAGFVQSGNGFNYVDGNPINQVDPTGLCPLPNGCRPFSQVYVQDRQDVRSMGGLALRRYPSTREESVIRRFPVGTLAIPMPVGPFRFFDRLWQYVAVSGEFGFLPEWNLKDQIEYLSETAPTSGGGTPPIQDLSGFKFGPLFRGGYRVLAEYGSDNPLTFQQWLPDLGRKGHNGVDLVPTTEVPEDPCKNKVPGREVLSPANGTLDIYNPDGSPSYPASNPAGITLDIQSIHGYPDLRVQLTHVYPSVENGPVQSGAPIGYYAQIGSSNYPHVHLTMFWKKELHDPTPYLP